ncbi:MAG: glycosyltransferase [Flavobacteriales bacterium]
MASDLPKILVFIDWFKPAYKAGGPVQSVFNLTAALSADMEFYICTSNTDLGTAEPLAVTSDEWIEFAPNISVIYLSDTNQTAETIRSVVHSQKFDAIYMNSVFSYRFSILPLWLSRKLAAKRIVASRGMLAKGSLALKKTKKTVFLMVAKLIGLYTNITWHVSAAHEAEDVKKQFGPAAKTIIAPNLPNTQSHELVLKEKKPLELDLFSLARIAEVKNLLFALQCLNHSFSGAIRYHIYGPIEDEHYWNQCKEVINILPENITVTRHGELTPDQIHRTISTHDFLFLPTFNENYGHVIIESFLASKPVLISDQTPWRNLADKHVGFELPLDSKDIWREKIQSYLDLDNDGYSELSSSAYSYGKEVLERPEDLDLNRSLFLS